MFGKCITIQRGKKKTTSFEKFSVLESRADDELNEYDYARKLEEEGVSEWNVLEAQSREEGEAEAETVQRIFDDMRKRFSPDLYIELADTASLPDGLRERVEKKKGAEGGKISGAVQQAPFSGGLR